MNSNSMQVSLQCSSCAARILWWRDRSQSKHFKGVASVVLTQLKTSSSSKRSKNDLVCKQRCLPNRSSSKLPLLRVDEIPSRSISESRKTKTNWLMKTILKLKLLTSFFKHLEVIILGPALTMTQIFADT